MPCSNLTLTLKYCLICKRTEVRPFVMAKMLPLPHERVARSVPLNSQA